MRWVGKGKWEVLFSRIWMGGDAQKVQQELFFWRLPLQLSDKITGVGQILAGSLECCGWTPP